MEKRKFGRTGHESTIAILGAAAFWDTSQSETDTAVELALEAGINHIDVAPSYGKAETLLGPWIKRIRADVFLGCKTGERTAAGAAKEMQESLGRLNTDHFDLYQCHAVTDMHELDLITGKDGALESMQKARDRGDTQYLGITTHGMMAPAVLLEALRRFDFDSVLFPLNFILLGHPDYRRDALQVIEECQNKNVGMMIIKSIARGRWGNLEKTHTTWYQPFTGQEEIQRAIDFVFSFPINGICTAGDVTLLPKIFKACENYQSMNPTNREALIASGETFVTEPLF